MEILQYPDVIYSTIKKANVLVVIVSSHSDMGKINHVK